jgi:aldehyde dehydrogenase (NAD+)
MCTCIIKVVQSVRSVFRSGRTLSLEWRRQQLTQLLRLLEEQADALATALLQDLNKVSVE